MKKIEAVIQPFKLDAVREILVKAKLPRINIFEVKGAGNQQGSIKQYRGTEYIEDSVEIKIEMVVDDDEAERLADRIIDALRTGDLSDGEVIILPVEQSVRLRAGQRGHRVRSWERDPAPSYLLRDATTLKSCLNALRRKFHEAG
jgi:nitrogen regulatory protein PII